jgi:ATP-dependent Lhr-like helicase
LWRNDAAPSDASGSQETVEHWAWQLLRRWGVVFRDLLEREAGAPRWYELVRVYRRMEARGEIRGGRFVKGVAGEQFASSETVLALRKLRDEPSRAELVVAAAADPVNLAGIITPSARVPSQAGNRVAFVNGVLAADWQGGRISWHSGCTEELRLRIRERLLQGVEPKRRTAANEQPVSVSKSHDAASSPQAGESAADVPGDSVSEGRLHVRIGTSRPVSPSGAPRPRF